MPSVSVLALCTIFLLDWVQGLLIGQKMVMFSELRIWREQEEALALGNSGPVRFSLWNGTVNSRYL